MTRFGTSKPSVLAPRLLLVLLYGALGITAADLLLHGHTETLYQWIPLWMHALALIALTWHVLTFSRTSLHTLLTVMMAFALTGLLGMWLHLKGNMGFALERQPNLSRLDLLFGSLHGATPVLAPTVMIYAGLLTLVYFTLKRCSNDP